MGKDFVEREYDSITLAERDKSGAHNRAFDFNHDRETKQELKEAAQKKQEADKKAAYEAALNFLDHQISLQEAIIKSKEDDIKKAAEIIKKNPGLAAKEEELRRPHNIERVKAIIESERLKEERAELIREHEEQV